MSSEHDVSKSTMDLSQIILLRAVDAADTVNSEGFKDESEVEKIFCEVVRLMGSENGYTEASYILNYNISENDHQPLYTVENYKVKAAQIYFDLQ